MWIQVRSMDGSKSARIDGLSKLSKIEDLRPFLEEKFDAPVDRQRLFYRGKQLEDGHTLFDYDVGLNDIIQILIRPAVSEFKQSPVKKASEIENSGQSDKETNSNDKENVEPNSSSFEENRDHLSCSKYYKIGDIIDAKDKEYGAWFEAKILEIKYNNKFLSNGTSKNLCNGSKESLDEQANQKNVDGKLQTAERQDSDDSLVYVVAFESYEDDEDPQNLPLKCIRPRARKLIKFEDVAEGDVVMVNYNIDEPKERGYWYDCKVTSKKNSRTSKVIFGTIFVGMDSTSLENCEIKFVDEIFAIEKHALLSERKDDAPVNCDIKRHVKPKCDHCKDIPSRKCKFCSCHICGGKDEPNKQILCDECDFPYHIWCLKPPLTEIPDIDEWYCPECKNDETEVVKAGEKLKESKKKAKMASANSLSNRDWGKGMACVGRTKECTIVPPNHVGPIPGVEVGMMWKFRVQVSETGVHRPHVAGIHGRESDGAYSIVLSGGYEDDLDEGEEFKYTGSGGRDLSGNKRTAEQSSNQTLTRMNKALALNCAAPIDNKKGAEAKDWKKGKPVRVVRNCKGRKHSKFSPEEGNRYDGIYKVVKYWPEKGLSGFIVWRYLLRRDDPTPAPWTKEGKKRIEKLGLTMQYPDGYLESIAEKEKAKSEGSDAKKGKRCISDDEDESPKKTKRSKTVKYDIPKDIAELIDQDILNAKLWEECKEHVSEGSIKFLKKVEDCFQCICCQEIAVKPVTTVCSHNICKPCLQRSFKAEVYSCPMCRHELGKSYAISVNSNLDKILLKFFPGYDAGRL